MRPARIVRAPVRLSTCTYATLWQYDNLGAMHTALLTETTLREAAEQESDERAAFAELAERSLLSGNAPHPDLRGSFELIRTAGEEFFGYFAPEPGVQFTALVVRSGDVALLAVLDSEWLTLRPVPAQDPARVLGGLMPKCEPMRIPQLNIGVAELRDGAPEAGDEVRRLRKVASGQPRARAEFYVARRDRRRRRVRCDRPVGVFDYPDGRIITRRTDRAREPFVSFLPGSPPVFVRAIEELHASVAP